MCLLRAQILGIFLKHVVCKNLLKVKTTLPFSNSAILQATLWQFYCGTLAFLFIQDQLYFFPLVVQVVSILEECKGLCNSCQPGVGSSSYSWCSSGTNPTCVLWPPVCGLRDSRDMAGTSSSNSTGDKLTLICTEYYILLNRHNSYPNIGRKYWRELILQCCYFFTLM